MKAIITILTLFSLSVYCLTGIGCHSRKNKAAEETPRNQVSPAGWFDAGTAFAQKGEYDQAIAAYNNALKADPLYASAYFYRAQIWEEKGNIDKAIDDYSKVIELNPGLENAYNFRGNAWQMKGKLDKALADYTKAVELDPNHAQAYHNRGNAWGKKGNYDKAVADFTRALEITPDEAAIYDNRGTAWKKKGDYKRAIADYTKALDIDPKLVISYNNLAWLLATCPDRKYRNGSKALEAAQKAAKAKTDASSLDTLAAANAEMGNFGDAVKIMERIISYLKEQKETEHLSVFTDHLNSYKAGKPWREK